MLYWSSFSGSLMFYPVYERALDVHFVYVSFCVCLFSCCCFYSLENEFGWFLTHIGRLPRSMLISFC